MVSSTTSLITLLVGGAVAWYLLLCRPAQRRLASPPLDDSPQPSPQAKGVRLCQVYPSPESNTATDIDVIAIHGLDTDSPRTWTWKQKESEQGVNWLKDRDMLPKRKTIDEFARLLLASIKSRPPATNEDPAKDNRPIVFIASCLGGIVLMKALVMADGEYLPVAQATRGIIFLATPFRGTSFQDVAKWAEPGLRAWASVQDRHVSNLLEHVKPTFNLGEIVRGFAGFCQKYDVSNNVSIFYETSMTSLPQKIIPWLPALWSQEQPLVNQASATLDFVPHPLPLDRPHIRMNKFRGPDDPGYTSVAGRVQALLAEVRKGQPVEIANVWIRNTRYSLENLKIERLSGALLPMDQCYINLAIVEQPRDKAERSTGKDEKQKSSPFSLFTRLRVERPEKGKEIMLPNLFEPRATRNAQMRPTRRVLIRGRAGVGKTTLCKKIIYEFTYRELWRDLFDCVLWVPLRRLKLKERRQIPGYNFKYLFLHEYFSQSWEGEKLAEAIWRAMDTKRDRILFILDGLDEAPQGPNDDMCRFLEEELLNQTNVIITSRPNATLSTKLKPLDLELETIGFYPEQVDEYITNTFTDLETGTSDSAKIVEIQSFLQRQQLIRGLVRIPIQLDALCYTWDDPHDSYSSSKGIQGTMTAIYQKIDQSLWRKDAEKLDILARSETRKAHNEEIRVFTDDEHYLLELLAFNGMYYDVIDFEPNHRGAISREYKGRVKGMVLDDMLGRVSFLRSSDLSSREGDQDYHFLHLTFQEYFGAQYFVRQWRNQEPLKYLALGYGGSGCINPTEFLSKNKYNTRYDIFWRFVAGLLNTESKTTSFFRIIEAEPRDLLGPAHQRLVARCLTEVSTEWSLRKNLEDQLSQWVAFECNHFDTPVLAGEIVLSVAMLKKALQHAPQSKMRFLNSLHAIQGLPEEFLWIVASNLKDKSPNIRGRALWALQGQRLTNEHLSAIVACLEDESQRVRLKAIKALKGQQLTERHLLAIVACLEDEDSMVRLNAIRALKGQQLTEEHVSAIVACLEDEYQRVRIGAIEALKGQQLTEEHLLAVKAQRKDEWVLTEEHLRNFKGHRKMREAIETLGYQLSTITPYLQDEDWDIRRAALEELKDQPDLSEELLRAIVACLKDETQNIRKIAANILEGQSTLSEETLQVLAAYLEDVGMGAELIVVKLLISQRALSLVTDRDVKSVYRILLMGSFDEHVSWHVTGGVSYITLGHEEYFQGCPDGFIDRIQEVRDELGVPSFNFGECNLGPRGGFDRRGLNRDVKSISGLLSPSSELLDILGF
ncbi:ARM repeat-containing protein [Xylaria longipes]|nr:ARM repeat-containing protein [Xylaria longipes]